MRAAALLALVLAPVLAAAHADKSIDRGVLQLRPDATELLVELVIPAGAESTRWRVAFDTDRNGRLSPTELGLLAEAVGEAVRSRHRLWLDGTPMPLKLADAKVMPNPGSGGQSGRIAALVHLQARGLLPGVRRVEVEATSLADPRKPVLLRLEHPGSKLVSLVGGQPLEADDGAPAVMLHPSMRATLRLDVPKEAK
jgi:hypothetical protein